MPLAPALADRARRLRETKTIAQVAAALGVSKYDVKMATTPGFAERQREHHRRTDARRAEIRKADPAQKAYKDDWYRRTKGLRIADAEALSRALKERRRQRGEEQADAAAKFGVTLTVYQRWEASRCPWSQIRLVTLALRALAADVAPPGPIHDR